MHTYTKWGAVPNQVGATGESVARHILDSNGLQHVRLEVSEGKLSDHYIPSQDLLRLSTEVNNKPSVAALAVAAHEVGHAMQDAQNYGPLKAKAVMMPVAAAASQLGMLMVLGASVLGITILLNVGMLLLAGGVLMQLLTLPIEFDASKRALCSCYDIRCWSCVICGYRCIDAHERVSSSASVVVRPFVKEKIR